MPKPVRVTEQVVDLLREAWEFPPRPGPADGEMTDEEVWAEQEEWYDEWSALDRRVQAALRFAPQEEKGEPYDPHGAMVAVLRASMRVRDGRWVKGAPTHVLAELLNELRAAGWELRRVGDPPPLELTSRSEKTPRLDPGRSGMEQRDPRGGPETLSGGFRETQRHAVVQPAHIASFEERT